MRNEDVVEVHHDVSRQDQILEDVVHHGLEGRRGVGHSEVHDQGFEEALVGLECDFPLITLLDVDVVKAPLNIEFCEEPGSFLTIDEIVDQREWVLVLHCHRIKHLVVLYEPEATVLLFDEEDWRCHQ